MTPIFRSEFRAQQFEELRKLEPQVAEILCKAHDGSDVAIDMLVFLYCESGEGRGGLPAVERHIRVCAQCALNVADNLKALIKQTPAATEPQ